MSGRGGGRAALISPPRPPGSTDPPRDPPRRSSPGQALAGKEGRRSGLRASSPLSPNVAPKRDREAARSPWRAPSSWSTTIRSSAASSGPCCAGSATRPGSPRAEKRGWPSFAGRREVDLVILDLAMPDLDGMAVLARMREAGFETPVIVQAAPGSVDAVMGAIRAGASDFVVKPVGAERLAVSIRNALARSALGERAPPRGPPGLRRSRLPRPRLQEPRHGPRHPPRRAGREIRDPRPARRRAGHRQGGAGPRHPGLRRPARPGLRRRELRRAVPGPRRADPVRAGEGRLRGATERQVGKFVEASGGTLFLDGGRRAVPRGRRPSSCARSRTARSSRSAGARGVRVDVRLIAATSRSLLDLVKAGRFREDLYYRLNVLPDDPAPLAGAARGRAGPRPLLPRPLRRRGRQAGAGHRARSHGAHRPLRLAGQRAPARERAVPRRGPRRGRRAHGGGVPPDRRPGRGLRRPHPAGARRRRRAGAVRRSARSCAWRCAIPTP